MPWYSMLNGVQLQLKVVFSLAQAQIVNLTIFCGTSKLVRFGKVKFGWVTLGEKLQFEIRGEKLTKYFEKTPV